MKFKFPRNATVLVTDPNAAQSAQVKVHDAILNAAGDDVNCTETKRGKRRMIEVHLKPGSIEECQFALALPSDLKADFESKF